MSPTATPIPVKEIVEAARASWTWPHLISGIVACVVTWMLCLLLYGYRSSTNTFRPFAYIVEKKDRFIVGLIMTFAIVILRITNQNFDQLLALIGFRPGPSAAVSLGLAIAAFVLSFHGKKKTEPNEQEMHEEKKI